MPEFKHECSICGKDCDCQYCGNEQFEGDDMLCTGCSQCEEDYMKDKITEAPDYGTTTD